MCGTLSNDGIRRLQIDNTLRGLNLAHPYHCFNRTTCTRGHFTPVIHSPDPEISEIRPGFELKCFCFLFRGSCVSSLLYWLLHKNIGTFCGCTRCLTVGMGSRCNKLGSITSITVVPSVPSPPLPCASTPVLGKDMLRFAYAVRVQEVARTLYRELATGQPHVPPMQNLRAPKIVGSKAKNFLLQGSRVFFRLRAFL